MKQRTEIQMKKLKCKLRFKNSVQLYNRLQAKWRIFRCRERNQCSTSENKRVVKSKFWVITIWGLVGE